jgi:hypothetical protein
MNKPAFSPRCRRLPRPLSGLAFAAWLGLAGTAAHGQGFVALPATGFPLENGVSAYTLCNDTGRFSETGRGKARQPTPTAHDACALFPANALRAPEPGFALVTHAVREAVVNNRHTGGADRKVANVTDFVWRNAEQSACIYGATVVALLGQGADHDANRPGIQYFEVNDFVRGGFAGLPVEAAYATQATPAQPVYRIGRTFTSVQYRRADGYLKQPPAEPAFEQAINGADLATGELPTPARQSASLDDNWVDFTTEVSLPRHPASAMFYVKTTCSAEPPQTVPDAIRLRQTTAPFIEVSLPGFVPPGGAVLPALGSPL